MSDRIFCETDIENRGDAISNLEKYLLKSNVASEEAELNAYIALEEKEKADTSKPIPIPKPPVAPSEFSGEWTIERVRNSLSKEVRDDHEGYIEERRNLFYKGAAEVQNLIEKRDGDWI